MKVVRARTTTRIAATTFSGLLTFITARGILLYPATLEHLRESAVSENRSWTASIVVITALMAFFGFFTVWILTFAVKSFRAPHGHLQLAEVRLVDKLIGLFALAFLILASAIAVTGAVTNGGPNEIKHGWLTAIVLPSVLIGTTWFSTLVWRIFRSSPDHTKKITPPLRVS